MARLRRQWKDASRNGRHDPELDALVDVDQLDLFDQAPLTEVVRGCRTSHTLSDAGRTLLAVSRESKAKPNDADRLRKYLARFNLTWQDV